MKVDDSKSSKLFLGFTFIVFGVALLIVAIVLLFNHTVKKENWISSIGTITEVDHEDEDIIFTYIYKNDIYTTKSSIYSSTRKLGDTFVIYINPDKPSEIYEHDLIYVSNMFFIMGPIFTTIAIFLFVNCFQFNKKRILCLEHGKKRRVKVGLIKKTNVRFNGRPYYVIFINYDNKEYKSHSFLMPRIFDMTTKKTVDLYIYDEKTYYIDVCSLEEKKEESDILEY